jgi:Phospholipid methyltransferase
MAENPIERPLPPPSPNGRRAAELRADLALAATLVSWAALAIGGCALAIAGPLASWSPMLDALFVSGALLSLVSFAALGKSFGILPGMRGIVTHGPYRCLRHPAYLAELLMVLAACLSRTGISGLLLFALAVPAGRDPDPRGRGPPPGVERLPPLRREDEFPARPRAVVTRGLRSQTVEAALP